MTTMKLPKLIRLVLFCATLAAPIVGIMAVSALQPAQQKKADPFPVSLFSQAKAEDYIDEAQCAKCHADAHGSFQDSPHAPFVAGGPLADGKHGCQSCHGPGGPHMAHLRDEEVNQYVINYSEVTAKQAAMACLRCHNDTMMTAHWQRTGHARADVPCTACHAIHQNGHPNSTTPTGKNAKAPIFAAAAEPTALLKADQATLCGSCHHKEVGEFRHNFHHPVPEGRMVCADCHSIHPRRSAEKMGADHQSAIQAASTGIRSDKETCVTCHAEVAGPFVFEHDPVHGLTGEGCMECHRPHGSNNPKMLNSFSRGLCAQCHTDKATNHFPGRTCWQSGCHVGVHGSNNDPLLLRR
jgi:predicted CXXCH cytochrome family protein